MPHILSIHISSWPSSFRALPFGFKYYDNECKTPIVLSCLVTSNQDATRSQGTDTVCLARCRTILGPALFIGPRSQRAKRQVDWGQQLCLKFRKRSSRCLTDAGCRAFSVDHESIDCKRVLSMVIGPSTDELRLWCWYWYSVDSNETRSIAAW